MFPLRSDCRNSTFIAIIVSISFIAISSPFANWMIIMISQVYPISLSLRPRSNDFSGATKKGDNRIDLCHPFSIDHIGHYIYQHMLLQKECTYVTWLPAYCYASAAPASRALRFSGMSFSFDGPIFSRSASKRRGIASSRSRTSLCPRRQCVPVEPFSQR